MGRWRPALVQQLVRVVEHDWFAVPRGWEVLSRCVEWERGGGWDGGRILWWRPSSLPTRRVCTHTHDKKNNS